MSRTEWIAALHPSQYFPEMKSPSIIRERSTLDSDIRDELESGWRYRALEAVGAFLIPGENVTPLSAILTAVLGVGGKRLPRLGPSCWIDEGGRMYSHLRDRKGKLHKKAYLGFAVPEFVGAFRSLADALELTDIERQELFAELRKWVAKDDRVADQQKESL